RSFAAPVIVTLSRDTVETERDVRNSGAVDLYRRPHTIEVPAVRNKADGQPRFADQLECFRKRRMKRRLAAGEADARDVRGVARFADYPPQKIDGKKLSVRTIEVLVRAKA